VLQKAKPLLDKKKPAKAGFFMQGLRSYSPLGFDAYALSWLQAGELVGIVPALDVGMVNTKAAGNAVHGITTLHDVFRRNGTGGGCCATADLDQCFILSGGAGTASASMVLLASGLGLTRMTWPSLTVLSLRLL
jgi:hypothetical protein